MRKKRWVESGREAEVDGREEDGQADLREEEGQADRREEGGQADGRLEGGQADGRQEGGQAEFSYWRKVVICLWTLSHLSFRSSRETSTDV